MDTPWVFCDHGCGMMWGISFKKRDAMKKVGAIINVVMKDEGKQFLVFGDVRWFYSVVATFLFIFFGGEVPSCVNIVKFMSDG